MLGQFSTAELEDLTEKFPYFQQAHLLLAKKYQDEQDSRFDQQLQLAALYSSDRALLFEIFHESKASAAYAGAVNEKEEITTAAVEEKPEEIASPKPETETEMVETSSAEVLEVDVQHLQITEQTEPAIEPVEQQLQEVAKEPKEEIEEPFSIRQHHSFDEWLKAFSEISTGQASVEAKTPEEKDEELDKLIMENTPVVHLQEIVTDETHYSKGLDRFIEEQIEKHKHAEISVPVNENELAPELITETMAKVYEMQKKYAKAIKAYEVLALKYPEKSGLFAARINYIKNIT
jgi:hypothetical protein